MTMTSLSPEDFLTATEPAPTTPQPHGIHTEVVDPVRLRKAFKAYTTRFVADAIERSPEGFHLSGGPRWHRALVTSCWPA